VAIFPHGKSLGNVGADHNDTITDILL
jgi:hypothetical protein